jgi:hypothetical protein
MFHVHRELDAVFTLVASAYSTIPKYMRRQQFIAIFSEPPISRRCVLHKEPFILSQKLAKRTDIPNTIIHGH